MVRIWDSSGHEREALTAALDLVVTDPVTGTNRQLYAGKPVPGDLEAAYQAALEEAAQKGSRKKGK